MHTHYAFSDSKQKLDKTYGLDTCKKFIYNQTYQRLSISILIFFLYIVYCGINFTILKVYGSH